MNVAHLTTVHPRNDTRIFRKMCCSLVASGHSVSLYVADGFGDDRCRGVNIIDVGIPQNRPQRVLWLATAMWRRALKGRHDVYHFHDPELIVGALACKLVGNTIIYDIHEYYRQHFLRASSLSFLLRHALARVYDLAEHCAAIWLDGCVAVSPHMMRKLRCRQSAVVANYVIAKEFQVGSTRFAERKSQVCYVGVLSKERCVDAMVDAANAVSCRLVLAGEWYPPFLRSELMSRPGWSSVDELGIIDRARMQREFEQSRAGLLINDLHGDEEHSSSNKLFEYMAAGLPVIASDIQFAREVISRHHCGLLISPPTDPRAIATAITWILDHPEEAERMGRAGRRAIEREYGWDQQANTLLRLYKSLDRRGRNH